MTAYYEQRPQVAATDDAAAPIHVSFSDVTLCLTERDASWLAANIQRVLRDLHRKLIESATPLTHEMRLGLKPGDRVVVRLDGVHPVGDDVYEVKHAPWQLGHGAWVIGLHGISGGYDLSRVTGIISTAHSRGPETRKVGA